MRSIGSLIAFVVISLTAYSASAQQTSKYAICQTAYVGTGTQAYVAITVAEYHGSTVTCPAWPDSTGTQYLLFCASGLKGSLCHPTVRYQQPELLALYHELVSALDTSRPALIFTDLVNGIQVPQHVTFLRQ